jgi:hypothetical protein
LHTWSGGGESLDGAARLPLEYMVREVPLGSTW